MIKRISFFVFAFALINSFDITYAFSKKISKNYHHDNSVIVPKTPNQSEYCDLLENEEISVVVGIGPAGCGKTLLACNEAIQQLVNKNVQKIVITRPVISVDDEQIGFLPGSMSQKMDPWTRPIFDVFNEVFSKQQMLSLFDNNMVEIVPLAYMRGRTFKNTFIIADEMQNSSPNQMLMLLTRIGEKSRIAITGDLRQSDRSSTNGLSDLINKIKKSAWMQTDTSSKIKYVEMDSSDIQRSEVLKQIIELYEN
jgi:phosphate starvation-inducible PhoH-like protein